MNFGWKAVVLTGIMSAGLLLCPAHAAGVSQAFLVQNSGWMEPFYSDPKSSLKPLVAAVADAVTTPEDPVSLLAFSQSSADNLSPRMLGQGTGAGSLSQWLAPLGVARKGTGAALADTDFQEAITKTITGPLRSTSGIVWIFTNNRNSPGNDQATAARNRDFYRLLHMEPSIAKTLVFPLKMPVKGKQYEAQGLMVYALAYGEPASKALDGILRSGRLSKVLTRPPARLKPLDADAVRIVPESVKNNPEIQASIGADQRTLVLDVDAGKLAPTVTLKAALQNLFYPYVIRHAKVNAGLDARGRTLQVQVTPSDVEALQPGEHKAVDVQFQLPLESVPSAWSPQAIAAMGKKVLIPMTVTLGLAEQQLVLADQFKAELANLFPGDPISEIFAVPANVLTSEARVPVLLRVQYPLLPVIVTLGAVLAIVGALAGLALISGRSRRYAIVVDGMRRNIVLKPFSSLKVNNDIGQPVGLLKRGLSKPKVVAVEDGHTLSIA